MAQGGGEMTPEERAKGIATLFQGYGHPANLYRREIALIAAEIREVSEKAFEEGLKSRKDGEAEKVAIAEWTEVYRQEAKAEAYEDAAKFILEDEVLESPDELDPPTKFKFWELLDRLAARLRARAAEVGK